MSTMVCKRGGSFLLQSISSLLKNRSYSRRVQVPHILKPVNENFEVQCESENFHEDIKKKLNELQREIEKLRAENGIIHALKMIQLEIFQKKVNEFRLVTVKMHGEIDKINEKQTFQAKLRSFENDVRKQNDEIDKEFVAANAMLAKTKLKMLKYWVTALISFATIPIVVYSSGLVSRLDGLSGLLEQPPEQR